MCKVLNDVWFIINAGGEGELRVEGEAATSVCPLFSREGSLSILTHLKKTVLFEKYY